MTLNEQECAQKWSEISAKLAAIDVLIDDITAMYPKIDEMENIEIAKLHQAAAYVMTELEKCKKVNIYFGPFELSLYLVKLRFTLNNEESKNHSIQIESVPNFVSFISLNF